MSRFAKGIIAGSVIAAALGVTGMANNRWMRKRVWRPSRTAAKKLSKLMTEVANMID